MTDPVNHADEKAPRAVRETMLGVKWLVRSDAAEALCAAKVLDIRALMQSLEAALTEKTPGRTRFRVSIPQAGGPALGIDVTIFKCARARDVAASPFRRANASRAWRAAERLEAAGIPFARVLAAGVRRTAGVRRDDVLIAEALDATPMDEFLAALDAAERARFLRRASPEVGRMVRRLHDRGLAYRNLNARSLHVREVGGQRQILLGRLDELRRVGVLSLGPRLDNIAQLAASLDGLSRTDRRRFYSACVEGYDPLERHAPEYARLMESRAADLRRARLERLEREPRGAGERFLRVRCGSWSGHTVRARMEIDPDALTRIPDRMAMPDATVIKDSPEARVYEQRIDFGAGIETIMVKHKRRAGALATLRTFGRRVGAVAAWRTLHAMGLAGLPVEKPLAAFERRCCGLTFESVLVTKKVAGAENLYRFVEARAASMPPGAKGRLARELGKLARRLHDLGFAQRDLKAPNILVGADGASLTLIDVEGVRRRRDVPDGIRARDLGRLAADFIRMPGVRKTDRARVLDAYLAGLGWPCERKREFIALITRRVQEKLAAWDSKRS